MNSQPSLARHLESFFHQRLTKQRNATRATVAAYRDALRLLILFASEQTGKEPCALAVEDLDRDLILAYLDNLERSRGNGVHTRNARLTAIRSFFRHVAACDPASIGIAQRVLSIPSKKSDVPTTRYLSRDELEALIDAPSKNSLHGRRDRVLLLFLARTGARVSEALGVDATDLVLDGARSQVLLRGKGRKQRMVPLATDLVKAIESLLRERGIARHEHVPVFVGARAERLTLAPEAARALLGYGWPLNIRELHQAMASAVALTTEDVIELQHLPAELLAPATSPPPLPDAPPSVDGALRDRIIALLHEHHGNVTAVARTLGKAPAQIHRWMNRFQIDPDTYRPGSP